MTTTLSDFVRIEEWIKKMYLIEPGQLAITPRDKIKYVAVSIPGSMNNHFLGFCNYRQFQRECWRGEYVNPCIGDPRYRLLDRRCSCGACQQDPPETCAQWEPVTLQDALICEIAHESYNPRSMLGKICFNLRLIEDGISFE
jgi:hypothetical protein